MRILPVLALLFPILATAGDTGCGFDWYKMPVYKMGQSMYYLGSAFDEPSHARAVNMAEQDAMMRMIRHFFGVKVSYSLQSHESLTDVSLSLDNSETSENLHLTSLIRTNIRVLKSKTGTYSAWVQISIPHQVLLAEKQRLQTERERPPESTPSSTTPPEATAGKVPKIYQGMPRAEFFKYYPAPNTISSFWPTEIAYFSPDWNFCSGRFLLCSVTFVNGKVAEWNNFDPSFINVTTSRN